MPECFLTAMSRWSHPLEKVERMREEGSQYTTKNPVFFLSSLEFQCFPLFPSSRRIHASGDFQSISDPHSRQPKKSGFRTWLPSPSPPSFLCPHCISSCSPVHRHIKYRFTTMHRCRIHSTTTLTGQPTRAAHTSSAALLPLCIHPQVYLSSENCCMGSAEM